MRVDQAFLRYANKNYYAVFWSVINKAIAECLPGNVLASDQQ